MNGFFEELSEMLSDSNPMVTFYLTLVFFKKYKKNKIYEKNQK